MGSESIACTLPATNYLIGEKDDRMLGLKSRFPCTDDAPHPKVLKSEGFYLPTIEWSVNGHSTHIITFDVTWSPSERPAGTVDSKRLLTPPLST